MTDIVERLDRARVFFKQCEDDTLEHLVGDAATEIKRLRAALWEIRDGDYHWLTTKVAKEALE